MNRDRIHGLRIHIPKRSPRRLYPRPSSVESTALAVRSAGVEKRHAVNNKIETVSDNAVKVARIVSFLL